MACLSEALSGCLEIEGAILCKEFLECLFDRPVLSGHPVRVPVVVQSLSHIDCIVRRTDSVPIIAQSLLIIVAYVPD